MGMTEANLRFQFGVWMKRHNDCPNPTTARNLHKLATDLVAISDDHQHLLDMADDEMAEYA